MRNPWISKVKMNVWCSEGRNEDCKRIDKNRTTNLSPKFEGVLYVEEENHDLIKN